MEVIIVVRFDDVIRQAKKPYTTKKLLDIFGNYWM